ncbi:hypothetical protein ACP4OV_020425 [Aristida adscensionis]
MIRWFRIPFDHAVIKEPRDRSKSADRWYPSPRSMGTPPAAAGRGGDRLSDLPEGVLGHILSFLPADEACRAAVLSSRWRDVLASVHTLSFEQPEGAGSDDETGDEYSRYYDDPDERRSHNAPFLYGVAAALLRRRRCAAALDLPLRALRLAFDWYHRWDAAMVDCCVAYAVDHGAGELHRLDLRLNGREICKHQRKYDREKLNYYYNDKDDKELDDVIGSDDDDVPARKVWNHGNSHHGYLDEDSDEEGDDDTSAYYTIPVMVFSCASSLRTLRLGPCRLNLPAAISLPCLDTLHLAGVADPEKDVRRLISGCPRLADLTLEACHRLAAISILDKHLRRLALICCHGLTRVAVDASKLRAFEYRGDVPAPSVLDLHGARRLDSCKIDLCGKGLRNKEELIRLKKLLKMLVDTTHLHLQSARLGSGMTNGIFKRFPGFNNLRHLELTGCIREGGTPDDAGIREEEDATVNAGITEHNTVNAVIRALEQAPRLEVLSLFILPDQRQYGYHSRWEHDIKYHGNEVPDAAVTDVSVPCLRHRVREINIVHYQGSNVERALVKFLLCNALVLDELCCVIPKGPVRQQTEMMNEIKSWVVSKSAKMIFL